jgi:hypothetical protein
MEKSLNREEKHMKTVFASWRESLRNLLFLYERKKGELRIFFLKLFLFFIVLNISCYWIAMLTAFSDNLHGSGLVYYSKLQFPVGLLGSLFDSMSFFVTIFIVRRALRTSRNVEYIAHLSIDLVIAILATLWVLFVFIFSGWLIKTLEADPIDMTARTQFYQRMLVDAAAKPTENWRNIYFGIIMGISASLPTCIHLYMFFRAGLQTLLRYNRN